MKVVEYVAVVEGAKCTGCRLCELECPTKAITMSDKLAEIEDAGCVACLRCFDVCKKESAISMVRRVEPLMCMTTVDGVDSVALKELCWKAHREPNELVCVCTNTFAAEIAAAILEGARSVGEVILATGAGSGCQEFCTPTVQRMLKASGVDITKEGEAVPCDQTRPFWDLPEEIGEKYPHFFFKEDRELLQTLRQGGSGPSQGGQEADGESHE